VLAAVAGEFAEAGRLPAAVKAANGILDRDQKAGVLTVLARAAVEQGDRDRAGQLAEAALATARTPDPWR
jgi:hypothetical protein